ncbi:ATP-dependent DNA helicase RuvA [Thermosipho melanesiensis]|uniref:Holliday junction branch migration complex subunit RuvA n=2 Tax=Thermosipho melanesiensis TaxID=46541 RepID=RUVA_THEM4|nr:Holliday junction branch migration protein RuvA [Thermosipho melanesiensis]A6LLH1.1 RecName: Full=Holliday junction branch migration complex subunit RuvA [Thermosipho melanesiensis BI429]ABR30772.1 Holliday junction DNA helicase RuvA [Thermosipho melanesiensis BI429]APT73895.1 ATP-dependent DNA helicase RuvA [Thermosipho melanesiensis]OOC35835.1 ATP-dependent DNA helicase RuvA [Thermosipho melanesiensis]OOC38337.1 ATP-dependent DNA helicase RuvA [Thermosipho melanesiensis]OOC38798.1 ATP-de
MIYAMYGVLEDIENGKLYLNVNEIVYEIVVGDTGYFEDFLNEKIKVFTKMIVNDDEISLYGFSDVLKLKLFEKLILVNKLGPKSALKIITSSDVSYIVSAIVNEDVKTLSTLPGIGPKTAERIILELKDSMKEFDVTLTEKDKKILEAIEALVTLGFSRNQSKKAVTQILKKDDSLDDIIKKALKFLSR